MPTFQQPDLGGKPEERQKTPQGSRGVEHTFLGIRPGAEDSFPQAQTEKPQIISDLGL